MKQDALLFSIDERDYRNTLREATSAKKLARQTLEIEKGQQVIAKAEWKLLKNSKCSVSSDSAHIVKHVPRSHAAAAGDFRTGAISDSRCHID